MPLDTSIYALSHLRLDGRRWNELRRIHAAVSTQAAADGSSYLELGNTKVMCTVSGPAEAAVSRRAGGGGGADDDKATVVVDVNTAGFSGIERKRQARGDRRLTELAHTISSAFTSTLLTSLYPRSTISILLHVLSQDGAMLAACINASTLALIDAGIPMSDYMVACTAGSISTTISVGIGKTYDRSADGADDEADPVLDLTGTEEQELPFLTAATLGASEKVVVLVMESKVRAETVEGMLAVAVDGCKQVREILDAVVRNSGRRMLGGGIK